MNAFIPTPEEAQILYYLALCVIVTSVFAMFYKAFNTAPDPPRKDRIQRLIDEIINKTED